MKNVNSTSTVILLVIGLSSGTSFAQAKYEENTRNDLDKKEETLASFEGLSEDESVNFQGNLSAYVAYAMKRSPKLRGAFERWRSQVSSISKNRRLPEPIITYGFYVLSVETRLGPQQHKLGLKQTFPWPTKLTAGADAASAKARAAQSRFDAQALELRARVAKAYYELWRIRRIVEVQKKVLGVAKGSSEAVRARLVLGQASLYDQQQIELFIARLEDAIETNRVLEKALASRLIFETGAPTGTLAPTSTESFKSGNPVEDLKELQQAALTHPALEALDFEVESSEAMAKKARAGRAPNITLGVDWIATGESTMAEAPADSGRDALIVGLGLSLPIWQRGYRDDEDAALAMAEALKADKRYAAQKIFAELDTALANITNTHRTIALHRTTLIPQAQAALESVVGAYSTNRSTTVEVLMAQRSLLDLQIALVRAIAQHEIAWVELERKVGRELVRDHA